MFTIIKKNKLASGQTVSEAIQATVEAPKAQAKAQEQARQQVASRWPGNEQWARELDLVEALGRETLTESELRFAYSLVRWARNPWALSMKQASHLWELCETIEARDHARDNKDDKVAAKLTADRAKVEARAQRTAEKQAKAQAVAQRKAEREAVRQAKATVPKPRKAGFVAQVYQPKPKVAPELRKVLIDLDRLLRVC